MARDNGGTAFPQQPVFKINGAEIAYTQNGMSLRDYFAAQALTAVVGNTQLLNSLADARPDGVMSANCARQAYMLADAMLAERQKGGA